MHIVYIIIFVCLTAISMPAHAQIALGDVFVEFMPNKRPLQNIVVHNTSAKEAFDVKVTAVKVINPGEENEERIETQEIIVAPSTIPMAANSKRVARMVFRAPFTDKEQVFRASFVPLAKEDNGAEEVEQSSRIKTKMRVLSGMGALVFAAPMEINRNLTWLRDSTGINFTNEGNVYERLERTKVCFSKDDCVDIKGRRLYPGNTWRLDLPERVQNSEVEYRSESYNKIIKIKITP